MIVNYEQRWAYIGPPRTASSVMHEYLQQPPFNGSYLLAVHQVHSLQNQHHFQLPPECDASWTIFHTTRHPLTRAMSLWRYYTLHMRAVPFAEWWDGIYSYDLFFRRAVSQWLPPGTLHAVRQESILSDLAQVPCFVDWALPSLPPRINYHRPDLPPGKSITGVLTMFHEDLRRWYWEL